MAPRPTRVHGYDHIAPVYDALAALYSGGRIPTCHRLVAARLEAGERVLFAGVGSGRDAALAARRGARPVLLDTSPALLDRAVARVRRTGVEPERVRGDLRDPSALVGTAPFDAVVASFFLNVFRRDELPSILDRCGRLLAPRGRIIVADFAAPRGGPIGRRLQRLYHDLPMHCFHRWTGNALHPIHETAHALEEAGFAIETRVAPRIFGVGPRWLEVIEGRIDRGSAP